MAKEVDKMEKAFKKIGTAILTLCLTVSCFSFVALRQKVLCVFRPLSGGRRKCYGHAKVISARKGVAVGDTDISSHL